jgi:hypothetical protein
MGGFAGSDKTPAVECRSGNLRTFQYHFYHVLIAVVSGTDIDILIEYKYIHHTPFFPF